MPLCTSSASSLAPVRRLNIHRLREDVGYLLEVCFVRCPHGRPAAAGDEHDMGIYHVGSSGLGEQSADLVSFFGCERSHLATTQEPSQLDLTCRPAHLGNHGCGRDGNEARFQSSAMIGPHLAVITISRDEDTGVVDDAHAERRLPEPRISFAIRFRADRSSASLRGPLSCSHSATAARPSRTRSALRAASVIHAETLNPSSAAAARTRSWTSGSTVMASFGEGFPLGTPQAYYRSRRVTSGR